MSKNNNPLVVRLFDEIKKRNISVPEFSRQTKIPKDRVYKWDQQGTSPKAEDEKIINAWIIGENVEKVPHETIPDVPESPGDKIIATLKESLKEVFKTSSGKVSAGTIIEAIIKLAENQDKILNVNSEAVATNKILAEANLLLSRRLSSSDIGLTSSPYQGEGNNQQHGIEQDRPLPAPPSDKKESHSKAKSGKQKDSGSVRSK